MSSIFLEKISKIYNHETIINSLSIELKPGKYYLCGANGAGKTTLLSIISGVEKPTSGRVAFQGKIDFCSDKIDIPPKFTVYDIISIYDRYQRSDTIVRSEMIEIFRFNEFLQYRYEDLSEGTKKKLKIILAFSGNGDWLLLDEPTNALDKDSIDNVINYIRNTQRSLILVDHSGLCVDNSFVSITMARGRFCIGNYLNRL